MKQRLCIGIKNLQPGWKSVLDQAGLWYEEIDFSKLKPEHYSTIILNEIASSSQQKDIQLYVQDGGSLIEVHKNNVLTSTENVSKEKASTLVNISKHKAFNHLSYIDVFANILKHSDSDIFEGLINIEKKGKGMVGFFGADLPALMNASGYNRKRFYNPTGSYPSEIVSKVSKNELSQAFISLLKELHFCRKLPMVVKWNSPKKKPVFCFRVDSDFGDKNAMDSLYKLADTHNVSLTWFLHVEAHEQWLSHFKSYSNQEIALHGYNHGTSSSSVKTFSNIDKGRNLLNDVGFNPKGFCAPYGIYNEAMMDAYRKLNFTYCSEFTFSYDGLPLQPHDLNLPLQIPIHPICTGSLKRQNYSVTEMSTYFEFVLQNKLARYEPAIFYHHPLQTGLSAINRLFKYAKAANLCNITFSKFADFWEQRRLLRFEAFWDEGQLEITSSSSDECYLQLNFNHQQFDLIKASPQLFELTDKPEFEFSNQYLPEPEQVLEMRKKDFKLVKTSILDWKNRIRL